MNIADLLSACGFTLEDLGEIDKDTALAIVDQHHADLELVTSRILDLVRKRAGIVPTDSGDAPKQRLNSPRLNTAYPGVRKQALEVVYLKNRTEIVRLIGPLVEAILKSKLAMDELEMEAERTKRVKRAMSEHKRDGIYKDVAIAADRLHELFGITYHHWRAISDEQLVSIARILKGEDK